MRRIHSVKWILATTAMLAACARSVSVMTPPEGNPGPVQSNPVSFTVQFHSRADVSTFRAFLNPPAGTGSSAPIDITSSFSLPLMPGGQSTAVIAVPQTPCHLLRVGCVDERRISVQANMQSSQAFDSRGHSRDFRLQGTNTPPPPPPPPTPAFQFAVPVTDTAVHWGASVAYTLQLSSQNGFAGSVTVTPQNLPFGGSAPPVTVNVPANGSAMASLTIATTRGMTALGRHSFMATATSPGAPNRTRALDLHVLPAAEAFVSLNWTNASSSCGGLQANVQGGTVSFQGGGFPNTTGVPLLWYAFTPECRGAVVFGPSVGLNQGNTIIVFNLAFADSMAAARGTSRTLAAAAYDRNHFRVSADGSHVIAVSQSGGSNHASLWNLLDLVQINPPHPFTGTLSARVTGRRVEATPSASNPFSWGLM